jgi:hypothetical protein
MELSLVFSTPKMGVGGAKEKSGLPGWPENPS